MAASTRQPQGYRNFGSFFTDDVEQMVAMSVAEWKDPELPQVVAEARSGRPAVGELGREMRRHFLLDFDNWTFINHGAFGATCQAAFREADAWRRHCEAQPLRFLDRQLFPHVVAVQRQLAQVVSCAPSDLVLQPNATTGLNAVFSSLAATAHIRRVFLLDIAYGSVKKMAQHLCRVANAELVVGHVPLPLGSSDDLLSLILDQIPRATDLVILDWVASNSALLLPLRQLIPACRERGVEYVVVDGAHALGQLPVDLTALGADFFVSNCHKWLCGSRGSAMLWVAPARKALVKPLVISHGSGRGFTSDFIWDGCRDYAPLLAVSAAIRFWHDVGFDRAVGYMRRLLAEATDLLVSAWSTGILAPLDCCGSMALVRLPEHLQISREGSRVPSSVEAKTMQDRLHHDYRIEVPVKCLADKLYVRVSVHVYNVLDDYRHLADVVKHMQP